MEPPAKKVRTSDRPELDRPAQNHHDETDTLEKELHELEALEKEFEQETGNSSSEQSRNTAYLDTIDRKVLDFDFDKLCSISLANFNVYACLTCGKYFQGRGKSSYAYSHSIELDHHVFINLDTKKIYVLPDGYEVKSPALEDIQYVLDPFYSSDEVQNLDLVLPTTTGSGPSHEYYDLARKTYRPGYVGLNNLAASDYSSVIIQVLAHIKPIRDYFMTASTLQGTGNDLAKRFGILVRKLWNPRAFKSHVSPHELLQFVSTVSKKQYTPIAQQDPFKFYVWFANRLHSALGGTKKANSSAIYKSLQGQIEIEDLGLERQTNGSQNGGAQSKGKGKVTPFLFLGLDLPPAPLFSSDEERQAIPQVRLTELLRKYDGETVQELADSRRRLKIKTLPPYLVLHINRFDNSTLSTTSRNRTIVSFSPQGLDMSKYVDGDSNASYNLLANVTMNTSTGGQDNETEKVSWVVQLQDKPRQQWVSIEDLIVTEVRPELLFLSESYIQVWERQ